MARTAETPEQDGRRARAREDILARLLAAAEAEFAEAGFHGATTARIAKRAGLPKANLHYYFKTKTALYQHVLKDILALWLSTADEIKPGSDPALALSHYIEQKMALARQRPVASRVFANEILHGAPHIEDFLDQELRAWVRTKSATIKGWIKAGKMADVDPRHLFFMIWAATQTYADFAAQIASVLGRKTLTDADYSKAAAQTTQILLRGLGLKTA